MVESQLFYFEFNKSKIEIIEEETREINLNSDKKKNWFSELKSLNDKTKCDSVATPADIVSDLIPNDEFDWFDEENYDPVSKL